MKKYFLVLSGLLLTAFSSKAQTITSGSFADLSGKTEVSVVFDYSETQVVRSKKTVSELVENDAKFAKTKEKQERYFIGSLNDDAKGVMEFGDYQIRMTSNQKEATVFKWYWSGERGDRFIHFPEYYADDGKKSEGPCYRYIGIDKQHS